jgi:hypothetical protein
MGVLKSIGTGLLSFVIVMTLPTGIFAYFFFQNFDPSDLGGQVFGSVLSTMFESEQFSPMLEKFETGLDDMLDSGLRDICIANPEMNFSEMLEMSEGHGELPEGSEMEVLNMMFSSISCADINETTTGADLVDIILEGLASGEIELPASLLNMTDMGVGMDNGLGDILSKLETVTGMVDNYVYYMVMVGLICSVLLLVVLQDPTEFSRKMGLIFLSQGLFMIIFVYGMEMLLPSLINTLAGSLGGGGMPIDIGGMITPILNALIFDPLKAVMWLNFLFVGGGAVAYIIGKVAERERF